MILTIKDYGRHTSALVKCPALAQETAAIVEEPMRELLAALAGSSVSEGSGSAREGTAATVCVSHEQSPQPYAHSPVDPNPLDPRSVSSRDSTKQGSSGENFSKIS